jgi:hypothetical protein
MSARTIGAVYTYGSVSRPGYDPRNFLSTAHGVASI